MASCHVFGTGTPGAVTVSKEDGKPAGISFLEAHQLTVEEAEQFTLNLLDGVTKARELDGDPI